MTNSKPKKVIVHASVVIADRSLRKNKKTKNLNSHMQSVHGNKQRGTIFIVKRFFSAQSWSWSLKALGVQSEPSPNQSRLSISVSDDLHRSCFSLKSGFKKIVRTRELILFLNRVSRK